MRRLLLLLLIFSSIVSQFGTGAIARFTDVDQSLNNTFNAWDTPPTPPSGLAATPGDNQVSLNWNDNSEPDLDGYNVYRATGTGDPYNQINGSLVVTSDYTDTTVNELVTYYYVVTAVDTGANESTYSDEVNAIPDSITVLDDGFEGTPWDVNWDGNGTTDWQVSRSGDGYGGSTYSASHDSGDTYLTSDDLNTSDAVSITVTFWFYIKNLDKGPLYVQTYNGSGYDNWYELTGYPGVVKTTWIQFSQIVTDSQYFRSDFRIRFDGSSIATDVFIDDVKVIKN
ncbi:MAG TPA: fibronectin type III domain-containing protein [Dehalococcoidia bacterium]|nr:fibronectin type III domain-containing protein [Dehalococcoidia bacterium]